MEETSKTQRQLHARYIEEQIDNDNKNAKTSGVSYGKYKAGLKADYEDSGYPVLPTEFVKPKQEVSENKKSIARIL